MSLEFGVAEILQRIRGETIKPLLQFDVHNWVLGRQGLSQSSQVTGVQAAETQIASFIAPRQGLFRVFATLAVGVAASVRVYKLGYYEFVASSPIWELRTELITGGYREFGPMDIFFEDGDILQWRVHTPMIAGDSVTAAVVGYEICS